MTPTAALPRFPRVHRGDDGVRRTEPVTCLHIVSAGDQRPGRSPAPWDAPRMACLLKRSCMSKWLCCLLVGLICLPSSAQEQRPPGVVLGERAAAQLQALLAAKASRTASERKMSFALLSAVQQHR